MLKKFFSKGTDVSLSADPWGECSALSPAMKVATREWWDAFRGVLPMEHSHENFKPLPVAYYSTAYLAQLVTGEIKFELPDPRLNAFVQKNLVPMLDRITQLTLVGGYTVIKPYITENGEVFFDVASSRDFLPLALDENGRITEGVFFERVRYNGKIYERREYHSFSGGIHTVRNSAVLYGTNRSVELKDIPQWQGIEKQGAIPSDIPMAVTFRTPYANNIDLDSRLPVSIFANSLDTLNEINVAHSEYRAEFKKLSAKVFADETVIDEKGIPDDYFVRFSGDGTSAVDQQIMTYAPPIREAEQKSAINTELRLYEVQIGVSSGTFAFDTRKGMVTATQVLSEDKATSNTVAQIQRQLRHVLEALGKVIVTLSDFYGFPCRKGDCAIDFGDSIFEDTGTEFARRLLLVEHGLLKPEEFDAWYFGVPLQRAKQMLCPSAMQNKSD